MLDQRTVGAAFYPRRGYVLNLQGGGAVESLLSDTSFVRLYGRHTQYFRAGDKGRLILRGELGSVLADRLEGIPTDFLFRAGGDNSVRGYDYQSLGASSAAAWSRCVIWPPAPPNTTIFSTVNGAWPCSSMRAMRPTAPVICRRYSVRASVRATARRWADQPRSGVWRGH